MRLALLASLLALVALCGCGTACDREAAAIRSANDKGAPCAVTASSFDTNKCNDALHSCSADDIAAMNNFSSCLEGLASCTNDTKTFVAARAAGLRHRPRQGQPHLHQRHPVTLGQRWRTGTKGITCLLPSSDSSSIALPSSVKCGRSPGVSSTPFSQRKLVPEAAMRFGSTPRPPPCSS